MACKCNRKILCLQQGLVQLVLKRLSSMALGKAYNKWSEAHREAQEQAVLLGRARGHMRRVGVVFEDHAIELARSGQER